MKSTKLYLFALTALAGLVIGLFSPKIKPKPFPAKRKKDDISRWEGEGGSI